MSIPKSSFESMFKTWGPKSKKDSELASLIDKLLQEENGNWKNDLWKGAGSCNLRRAELIKKSRAISSFDWNSLKLNVELFEYGWMLEEANFISTLDPGRWVHERILDEIIKLARRHSRH